MDPVTFFLLAAIAVLAFLLVRAHRRPVREVRLPPPLPPVGALAEDLYDAFRRACPVLATCVLPEDLKYCNEGMRAGFRSVAAHLHAVSHLEPPTVRVPDAKGPPGLLYAAALALLCLGVASCTPLQKQVAQERATAGALDFAACSTMEVAPQLVQGLAATLDGSSVWRADLIGAGGTAIKCALLALVRQLRQAEVPTGEAGVSARGSALSVDPAAQVQQLAQRCEQGPCSDVRERAAWVLVHGRPK